MRKTLGVCLLVLFLTYPTSAGEMPNGSPEPPPPSSPAIMPNESPTSSQPTGGEMTAGEAPDSTTGTLTQIALDLLAVFPALL